MSLFNETQFAVDLFQQATSFSNGSLLISPLSISLALSVVRLGAEGETASQIEKVLGHGFVNYFSALQKQYDKGEEDVTTDIANKLFVDKMFALLPEFIEKASAKFDSSPEVIDTTNTTAAAKIVNDYVDKTTNGKIKTIVDAKDMEDVVMSIVNALYFESKWESRFDEGSNMTFSSSSSENKTLTFVQDVSTRDFYENSEVALTKIPYKNTNFSFTLIVPKEEFGLENVMKSLTGEKLAEWTTNTTSARVSLLMPEFKTDTELNLGDNLQKMGMTDMFSSTKANFSGISDKPVYVSQAKHKTMIDVNREGTVAAAVTAFEFLAGSAINPAKIYDVHADHPFLYLIENQGHILFIGQYY